MDVHEQRVRFVIAATQKTQSFSALCSAYEISRPTGYLWLQRYQELGIPGIAEQSRKPHRSPRRTASELEQQVVQVRRRYPDWGARETVQGSFDFAGASLREVPAPFRMTT